MDKEFINEIKKYSILCVEDEDGIRKRLINILSYYFDDIYEANSGQKGFEIYSEYKPNIIFTDIQMNDGDGIELIKKIRKNDIQTKIVVLTAYSSEEYLFDLINLNIDHYILKPFNATKLKDVLKKILREKLDSVLEIYPEIFLTLSSRELRFKEEVITIRKREKDFLLLLFENKNNCVTLYSQIEEVVWENSEMTTSALKTFIRELRKKLPIDIIVNVPQEGYTFKYK